jgi:hypothetical protein
VPEMESLVNQAHRAANSEAAWNYPNFFNPIWRPLSIPPKFEESPDSVNNDDNDMTQMSRHRNVTHGERHALHAQQNQRFQDICVNRPFAPLHEDEDVMAPELPAKHRVDDNCKFLTALIIYIYIYIEQMYLSLSHVLACRKLPRYLR